MLFQIQRLRSVGWQVQRLIVSDSSPMKGTVESLVTILQTQGWKQLFSGLSINYLKVRPTTSFTTFDSFSTGKDSTLASAIFQVVPSVAIGFTVYDVMKASLRVPSRDEGSAGVASERQHSQPSSLPSSPSLSQTQQ